MDIWKFYDITHRYHDLCNPTNLDKLDEMCALLGLQKGARVLDVGCGKGELLVRLAERYQSDGVGVDLSPYAVSDAQRRHRHRAPEAALNFVCQDGAEYLYGESELFDLTMCIGATWIWNGYRGTLDALSDLTRSGGLILVGESFWIGNPPQDYLDAEGMNREDLATHHGNIMAGEDEGLTILYSVVSSVDDWDRYEGLQWYAAAEYTRKQPTDLDRSELMRRVTRSRESYLRWGREFVGWALYLYRKP